MLHVVALHAVEPKIKNQKSAVRVFSRCQCMCLYFTSKTTYSIVLSVRKEFVSRYSE